MSGRIHLVVDEREHEAFRASAMAQGVTLSEWLRDAARQRLERDRPTTIATVADLDRFFADRGEAEAGNESDWEQHITVMNQSRRRGLEPG